MPLPCAQLLVALRTPAGPANPKEHGHISAAIPSPLTQAHTARAQSLLPPGALLAPTTSILLQQAPIKGKTPSTTSIKARTQQSQTWPRLAFPFLPGERWGWKGSGEGENESKPFRLRLQSHQQQEPSEQFKYKMNCFNI